MSILNENRMFGDIFKELRIEKKMSQDRIAEELDVSQGLITKWESHQSTPSPEMMDYIADYFDVSTDYLTGRTDMRNNPMDKLEMMDRYKYLLDSDKRLTPEMKAFFNDMIETQHKKFDEAQEKGNVN